MKRLLPVGLSAVVLVVFAALMFRPVPQSMRDRPPKTTTTSTTTTTIGTVNAAWGSVVSAGLAPAEMEMCANAMVDVQVVDLNVLGTPNRYVKLMGASGNIYAVTPVVLKPGTNPVILNLCSRQDVEWRQKVVAPWGEHEYTLKSYPRCVHHITETALEDDSIVLTSFCPNPKS